PYSGMMLNIILPQAIKNILPSLVNELISLTKESAFVTIIGLGDIMRRAYIVGGETYKFFEPILFAGLIYYVMVMVLTILGKVIERRM
ncbi:ABC transporter permease subunit, partial [Enterococcus faecium]|uniref:ABC transporter permease subunit n=1 Tax=Enterococcus faecium TaxID=1352 RepID=UPI0039FC2265